MARGAIVSELAGGAIGRKRMLTAAYGFVSEG
jgi:hypothetical protein